MHLNVALEQGNLTDRSHPNPDELNDAWFDAAPVSSVRRRIPAVDAGGSHRSAPPPKPTEEIDPVADAWFR